MSMMATTRGGFFCEVIDSFLYLGSYYDACSFDKLEEFKINFILNVKDSCRFPPKPFELKHVPVDDYGRTNLLKDVFPKCFKFLDKVKENKGRVLIHCQSGVNRSASIVLAYLMTYRKMTFKEAFLFLRERRPIVSPHESYMKQLSEYEMTLYGKSTLKDITFVPLQETLRKLRIVTDYRVIRGAFHTARDILTGTAVYTVTEEEEVQEILAEVKEEEEPPIVDVRRIPTRSSSSEPNFHRKMSQPAFTPPTEKCFTPPVRPRTQTSLGRWERAMNRISNSPKSSSLLVKVLKEKKKNGMGSLDSSPSVSGQ